MSSRIRIVEEDLNALGDHLKVSIAFQVTHRYLADGRTVPVPVPWPKDYDENVEDRLDTLPRRFDTSAWGLLAAYEGAQRVGGLVVAMRTPGFHLLEGRSDLAHVIDLRVAEASRGTGIGRRLWAEAEKWSREQGAGEIRVETQDVNSAACFFYQRMGCRLHSTNPSAYDLYPPEVQLIWAKSLAPL